MTDHLSPSRRAILAMALATPAALMFPAARRGAAASQIPIGDMHFHLFFVGPRPANTQPLARNMASGGATLVSWSLVGDMPWLTLGKGGFKQKGTPRGNEPEQWLVEEIGRIRRHIDGQGLKIVRTSADVDRALAGEPHVVLSVEGATFADLDVGQIRTAHDLGVRQLQLVHYIRNPFADFQTERPEYNGLTDAGREAIKECERLGILVDLAHCTDAASRDALRAARKPLVWSHGSVAAAGKTPSWTMPAWQARKLRLETAKMIADKGGVVGLWGLGADVGTSVDTYARRMMELAEWLGEDHVAFGSDMNALAKPALSSFADHRRVLQTMQKRGVPDTTLRKLAIENYARVLKTALGE
ncbi:MAG: dipeptidase [Hyphomicrobiaceae bacterium]